jgi:hypothetical protein
MSEQWNKDRVDELEKLIVLVNELSKVNWGTGALERIKLCIDLAEELRKTDFKGGRVSFVDFLSQQSRGGGLA